MDDLTNSAKIDRGQCNTRLDFLRGIAGAGIVGILGGCRTDPPPPRPEPDFAKAMLLHLGRNWWGWRCPDGLESRTFDRKFELATRLETDADIWRRLTDRVARRGLNTVVIDINEALAFPSHPEIAVGGAWNAQRMRDEVARLRGLGIEPVPKLNFSTTHSGWLGDYQYMLATRKYYRVCADVIRDVVEIFGTPRYFHIGFDEESVDAQRESNRTLGIVVRKDDLWWHDFLFVVREVERLGVRPWMWSDRAWHHDDFCVRCPKSVLQSNWFYDEGNGGFDLETNGTPDRKIIETFFKLDRAGFDQIPCGTNWAGAGRKRAGRGGEDIIGKLVAFARQNISPDRLKGFLMTSWKRCTTPEEESISAQAIDLAGSAMI